MEVRREKLICFLSGLSDSSANSAVQVFNATFRNTTLPDFEQGLLSRTPFPKEVGQSFDVTRERIRQIEAKALRKLRHPSRSGKLRSLLDDVDR